MSERVLTNPSMNDKWANQHKQEDSFKSVHSNSCGQKNINEANASSLPETSSRKLHSLFCDSSAKLDSHMESHLNGEPSTFNASLPVSSLLSLPHGSHKLLSQENQSDIGMHRASDVDFNRIDTEVKLMSARSDDEKRGTAPAKVKNLNESSNSLRILISSEASDKVDQQGSLNDRGRKDREAFERPHKIVPSSETGHRSNHLSQEEPHIFPDKWYEDAEDDELTSATFSGPIAYSGPVSYSGPIPHSGSLSHRSDSSTSARSFAFPILPTEWTNSPVRMAQPDSRLYKQRRKRWRFFCCFCCKKPSTLYE